MDWQEVNSGNKTYSKSPILILPEITRYNRLFPAEQFGGFLSLQKGQNTTEASGSLERCKGIFFRTN